EQTQRRGDATQEAIVSGQLIGRRRTERAGTGQAGQRVERAGRANAGPSRAVPELERLGQELDVDETARAVLHVTPTGRLLAQLDLHALAHLRDGLDLAAVERRAVDDATQEPADAAAQRAIAEDQARARERLPLPQITILRVVALGRGEARGEPAAL